MAQRSKSRMEAFRLLEREIGAWMGYQAENVVVCNSGSAALHLALESFRLPQSSEVITSDYNMIAVPRAIHLAGLTPVFMDCDERLCLNPYLLSSSRTENELLKNVKAIVAVHIYGRQCDMEEITYYSSCDGCERSRDRYIIEDLAEAHGVKPHPSTDAACWSFHRSKHVHGEEGGAVAFRDKENADYARRLRDMGFNEDRDYVHLPRGMNYRLANCLAEQIRFSLDMFKINNVDRRRIESWYDGRCPNEWKQPKRDAVWMYDLRIPDLSREKQLEVVKELNREFIHARCGFQPMSSQEELKHCKRYGGDEAYRAAREVIALPVRPGETSESSVAQAFSIIEKSLRERNPAPSPAVKPGQERSIC